ncbi:Elongator subunit elp6 [Coemansia sp. Benny D160-2]|nr:Elongator subunit elp6 [Coemansia sp. Benny D160-2]
MYKTLSSAVNWPQGLPEPGTTTVVCGDIEADGSVVVPHFIQGALQETSPGGATTTVVVLVSLTQTMSHYMHVMRKMGVNLARHPGRFQFVDALTPAPVGAELAGSGMVATATRPHFSVPDRADWSGFFGWLADAQPPGCTVVVDGLCSLLDQGLGCDFAVGFVDTCRRIVEAKAARGAGAARLVATLFLDDFSEALARSLVRRSHYVLSFEALASGSSTEVAGQLTVVPGHLFCHIQKKEREAEEKQPAAEFKPALLHYRVSDTTVEFFSPGQSRMVL